MCKVLWEVMSLLTARLISQSQFDPTVDLPVGAHPRSANASAQGRCGLFPIHVRHRVDLGTDQRTLGGATLWPSNRRAVGGGHHADSDGPVGTVGDPAIPRKVDIRLDDLDRSGGSGDIGACRVSGGRLVEGVSSPRVSGELRHGPRPRVAADAPVLCRNADARDASRSQPRG